MKAWRDRSIKAKQAIALLLFTLLILGNVVGMHLYISAQEDTATALNTAGQQRFLLQKMLTESERIAAGQERRAELRAATRAYDQSLTALSSGDPSARIPSPPKSVREQLQAVSHTWASHRNQLTILVSAPPDSREFQQALSYIRTHHNELLSETDQVVTLYERTSERRIERLQMLFAFVLVIDLLAVIVGWIGVSRSVTKPLQQLTEDVQAIAAGDLERDMRTRATEDEVGQTTTAVSEMRDQLLDALEEARDFQHAVEHAGHAIYMTDSRGEIEYINPAFEETTGYQASEAIGKTPRILKSGAQSADFYAGLWETILDGEVWQGELVNQRKSGERYTVQQTIAPITDERGEIERFVAINTDITMKKRRMQVLGVLNRVLRHNLRNELTVLWGRSDLILSDRLDNLSEVDEVDPVAADIREDVEACRETGLALHQLSEKARKVQRIIEADTPDSTSCRLVTIIHRKLDGMSDSARDFEYSIHTPSHRDIWIADGILLEIAMQEILENALEHNDNPSPRVTISVSVSPENAIEISIADNGPGIPQYERRVLQSGEETPLLHGSGLGLWLVYWIMTVIGGTLDIEPNNPRGSILRLSIPIDGEQVSVAHTGDTVDA